MPQKSGFGTRSPRAVKCALFEIHQLVTRGVIGYRVRALYGHFTVSTVSYCYNPNDILPEWEVVVDSKGAFASVTCIFPAVSP